MFQTAAASALYRTLIERPDLADLVQSISDGSSPINLYERPPPDAAKVASILRLTRPRAFHLGSTLSSWDMRYVDLDSALRRLDPLKASLGPTDRSLNLGELLPIWSSLTDLTLDSLSFDFVFDVAPPTYSLTTIRLRQVGVDPSSLVWFLGRSQKTLTSCTIAGCVINDWSPQSIALLAPFMTGLEKLAWVKNDIWEAGSDSIYFFSGEGGEHPLLHLIPHIRYVRCLRLEERESRCHVDLAEHCMEHLQISSGLYDADLAISQGALPKRLQSLRLKSSRRVVRTDGEWEQTSIRAITFRDGAVTSDQTT